MTPGNTKTVNPELKSFCLLKTLEKSKEEYMLKVVKLYLAKLVRDITQNLALSALFWDKPWHGQI